MIRWGAAMRPKHGQTVSGDTFVVCENGNHLLAAVIDGLGGGSEAARAAEGAAAVLRANPHQPLQSLIRDAHEAIHATRGAVIGVLAFQLDIRSVSYVGIGNIGVYVHSKQAIHPISKNGILGFRFPSLLELTYTYDQDDVFVMYSDGVDGQFTYDHALSFDTESQLLANTILETYGKHSDDATVLAVRL